MKVKANPTLTKKQSDRITKLGTLYTKATTDLLVGINEVSKEHEAFQGLAKESIKQRATVKVDLNQNLFGPAAVALGVVKVIDEVKKIDGKDTLVDGAKIDDYEVDVKVIDANHALFKPMQSLWKQIHNALRVANGWDRMRAKRAIDAAWELKGITLKQRDLTGHSQTEKGIAKLDATDQKVANTAFEMIRDHVAGDGDITKKQWAHIAKICRQMANEVTNHTA